MSKRAFIYIRVSSSQQADNDYDPEGFSIPAQRDACKRKADALEAVVVDEFVDRGESAKTANRPALQAMLRRLKTEQEIDYVIVHKIDRLARNRADDVAIVMAIRSAGAQVVSVTENIDETPSGLLLHGIMSSIAEFYSRNLAAEIMKGTTQKAKNGGTLARAPARLPQRPRVDRRPRDPHRRDRSGARATGSSGVRAVRHRELLTERPGRDHAGTWAHQPAVAES